MRGFPLPGAVGEQTRKTSDSVLSNRLVDVLLKTSSVKASGPASPTVTVTFSQRFKHAVAHHFRIEAKASNDSGATSPFEAGGSLNLIQNGNRKHHHRDNDEVGA